MSKNASKFKNLIDEKEFFMEESELDKREIFAFEENIKNGPRVRIVIGFENEDYSATVFVLNYVNVSNPSKKEYFYELINELNIKYLYHKFTLDKSGNIIIGAHLPIGDCFDPQTALDIMIWAFKAAEEEYSRFMKLQWS